MGPTRRSLRVVSQSFQSSERNAVRGRNLDRQSDISSWPVGGPQSQQSQPPSSRLSPWGSAESGRQTANVAVNFDNPLEDSESDIGSDGELDFKTDKNMKVILLDIRRNVKQINQKFDKMKKSVRNLQKSNLVFKILSAAF